MRGVVVGLSVLLAASLGLPGSAGSGVRPPPEAKGHWVVLVEGDARALGATALVTKPDPFGGSTVASDAAIVVRDAEGRELGSYPLDLSHFDLDPAHVGLATRVDGCAVRETKVSVLATLPAVPGAATLEFRRGERLLGGVDAEHFAKLLASGGGR